LVRKETTTGGTMDELERTALAAADSMIAAHGWPWNLNPDGKLRAATEKSRLMLASAFLKGYGHGVHEMGTEADAAMRQLIADIENA
jgi:hypothetical protein